MTTEVRLDRMRPADIAEALARAPVAWVPLGAMEFHAPHLPLGTDSITASHLVTRAAEELGGVVLPGSTVTLGTLHLPWSLRYDASLVEAVLRGDHRATRRHSGPGSWSSIPATRRSTCSISSSGCAMRWSHRSGPRSAVTASEPMACAIWS